MTQIIVYGSIFNTVRPSKEKLGGFFHCPERDHAIEHGQGDASAHCAKRVAAVRRMESERYARQQREIEEDYRKRALESARLDTYEDPRNRHD